MKLIQFVTAEGGKLSSLLEKELKTHERVFNCKVKDIIKLSHVYVGEKKNTQSNFTVKPKGRVSLLIPIELFHQPPFVLTKEHIVYEDPYIVVLNKPAGLATQQTLKPLEDHLYGAVIAYCSQEHPGHLSYVGLHHRLDRMTSGLVLMTKKPSMNKSIGDQFKAREIFKKYIAVVIGKKPERGNWTVEAPIARLYNKNGRFKFGVNKKGDTAKTEFKYLTSIEENKHLIECRPITGRTHQIRIHLAHVNLPIWGDLIYGVKGAHRMHLHASELSFTHPSSKEKLSLKSEPDFI